MTDSAKSTELLIQCSATQCQSCGAAVGAVVGVIDEMALSEEFLHFFQR